MPLDSPTCTISSTFFTFHPTQRGQYHFSVSARGNTKLPMSSSVFSFSKIRRTQATLSSPDRIEVNVHTAFEEDTTIQTNEPESYNSTNEQLHKPNAWGLDDDVERGM